MDLDRIVVALEDYSKKRSNCGDFPPGPLNTTPRGSLEAKAELEQAREELGQALASFIDRRVSELLKSA